MDHGNGAVFKFLDHELKLFYQIGIADCGKHRGHVVTDD